MGIRKRVSSSSACCCNPSDICYRLDECVCHHTTPCNQCPADGVYVSKLAYEWMVLGELPYVIQISATLTQRCCVYLDEETDLHEYEIEEVTKLDDFLLIYSESEDQQGTPIQQWKNVEGCSFCEAPTKDCRQFCGMCTEGKVCGGGAGTNCAGTYSMSINIPSAELFSTPNNFGGSCGSTQTYADQRHEIPTRNTAVALEQNPYDEPYGDCFYATVSDSYDEENNLDSGWKYGGDLGGDWLYKAICTPEGCAAFGGCGCCSACCLESEYPKCDGHMSEHMEHCAQLPDWACPTCAATRLMGWGVKVEVKDVTYYCDPDGHPECFGECCPCGDSGDPYYDCCGEEGAEYFRYCTELPCTVWEVEIKMCLMTNPCLVAEEFSCTGSGTIQQCVPPFPRCPEECMDVGNGQDICTSRYYVRSQSCSCPDACTSGDAHCASHFWTPLTELGGDCDRYRKAVSDPVFLARVSELQAGITWSIG